MKVRKFNRKMFMSPMEEYIPFDLFFSLLRKVSKGSSSSLLFISPQTMCGKIEIAVGGSSMVKTVD